MIVSLRDAWRDEPFITDGVVSEEDHLQVKDHCISSLHPLPLYLSESGISVNYFKYQITPSHLS